MEDFLSDLRLAVRGFLRAPAFTAAAVAALALGIGGSSAIFSVLDGVVLQPLRAPHAVELVRVYETDPAGDPDSFSPRISSTWRRRTARCRPSLVSARRA